MSRGRKISNKVVESKLNRSPEVERLSEDDAKRNISWTGYEITRGRSRGTIGTAGAPWHSGPWQGIRATGQVEVGKSVGA